MGPLSGIRVIELAVWHNGGGAGYMLGDLGADVIKIEQPVTGDPSRGVTQAFGHNLEIPGGRALWFEMVNRGKRAITLNLKSAQGKEALRRLISKADVFFTNFTMDVVERLGVDYESPFGYKPQADMGDQHGLRHSGPAGEQARVRFVDTGAQRLHVPHGECRGR